jgi:hypothetical protein
MGVQRTAKKDIRSLLKVDSMVQFFDLSAVRRFESYSNAFFYSYSRADYV